MYVMCVDMNFTFGQSGDEEGWKRGVKRKIECLRQTTI